MFSRVPDGRTILSTVSGESEPAIRSTALSIFTTRQILSTASIELEVLPIVQTASAKSATVSRKLTLGEVAKAFPLPWSHYVPLLSAR
jgi:precorrin-4 methylase